LPVEHATPGVHVLLHMPVGVQNPAAGIVHAVPTGWNPSAGHVTAMPLHISATSH
jgi:hypothetical protein